MADVNTADLSEARNHFKYLRGRNSLVAIQKHRSFVRVLEQETSAILGTDQERNEPYSEYHLGFMPDIAIDPHFNTHFKVGLAIDLYDSSFLFALCPEIMATYYIPFHDFRFAEHESWSFRSDCSRHSFETKSRLCDSYGLKWVSSSHFNISYLYTDAFDRVSSFSATSLISFKYRGIPVGKLCCFDLVLATKIHDFSSPPIEIMDLWRSYCISCILAIEFIRAITSKFLIKSATCFGDYAPMSATRLVLKSSSKVDTYTINNGTDNGGNPNMVQFHSHSSVNEYTVKSALWPLLRNKSFNEDALRLSVKDIFGKIAGQSAFSYSPSISDWSRLAQRPDHILNINRKDYALLLTSSLDEFVSTNYLSECLSIKLPGKQQIFDDQTSWIEESISHAIENEYQLVVRLHPRMCSDHRVKVDSQYFHTLQKRLSRYASPFVHIVWPSQPISTYWLILWSRINMISWSTVGLDAARLGAHVISAFNYYESSCIFPEILFGSSDSRDHYFSKILSAFDSTEHLQNLYDAHHFWVYDALYKTVDLSGPSMQPNLIDLSHLSSQSHLIAKRSRAPINYLSSDTDDFISSQTLNAAEQTFVEESIARALLKELSLSVKDDDLYKSLIATVPLLSKLHSLC